MTHETGSIIDSNGETSVVAVTAEKPKKKAAPKAAPKAPKKEKAPKAAKPPKAEKAPAPARPAPVVLSAKGNIAKRSGAGDLTAAESSQAARLADMARDMSRLMIIGMIAESGEKGVYVGRLSGELNMSQPAISHHLALMRNAGVVVADRQGKNNFYVLTPEGDMLWQAVRILAGK